MSTQIRTWTEGDLRDGEPARWDLAINGVPVPGGYIARTESGFEIHYPHLAVKTLPTLEEAKRHLELAPPITAAGPKVDRSAAEGSELISTAEAGELLGVSRFRVNAMVASGVLPGRREGGSLLVDRAAVEHKAAAGTSVGPQGKFANLYLFYIPAGKRTQYVAELDAADGDLIEQARAFVKAVLDDNGGDEVEVRDFLRMRNFMRNHENEYEFASLDFPTLRETRESHRSLREAQLTA